MYIYDINLFWVLFIIICGTLLFVSIFILLYINVICKYFSLNIQGLILPPSGCKDKWHTWIIFVWYKLSPFICMFVSLHFYIIQKYLCFEMQTSYPHCFVNISFNTRYRYSYLHISFSRLPSCSSYHTIHKIRQRNSRISLLKLSMSLRKSHFNICIARNLWKHLNSYHLSLERIVSSWYLFHNNLIFFYNLCKIIAVLCRFQYPFVSQTNLV